jgi:hypothetical protein
VMSLFIILFLKPVGHLHNNNNNNKINKKKHQGVFFFLLTEKNGKWDEVTTHPKHR